MHQSSSNLGAKAGKTILNRHQNSFNPSPTLTHDGATEMKCDVTYVPLAFLSVRASIYVRRNMEGDGISQDASPSGNRSPAAVWPHEAEQQIARPS